MTDAKRFTNEEQEEVRNNEDVEMGHEDLNGEDQEAEEVGLADQTFSKK